MKFNDLFRKKSVGLIMQQAASGDADAEKHGLHKTLGVRDLTAFGIAAIIGAGIFSTIGKASAAGGPGVILLFIFTAIACSFAALAYAEFASLVPVSGSAYTYSYVAFGELFAWIIGWALIMEYAIGNITVAISWSDYWTTLVNNLEIGSWRPRIPEWMTMDYFTAKAGFENFGAYAASGDFKPSLALGDMEFLKWAAWKNAPTLGNFHVIVDIPALAIIVLITGLVYIGMKESRTASNIMVAIKLAVALLVVVVGVFYVNSDNWTPFLPNGVGGLLAGISSVFFAYIGFDAISTTAEECRNPQRDMPRGIIYSIVICTILYVLIALVITGLVSYTTLNVGDPLAEAFKHVTSIAWLSKVIAVSAVIAIASVLLVFQMGQPRIWLAMSRDGLLPKSFSRIHPRFRTPSFATVVTGFVVAIPTFFLDLSFVVDVCSLGTLFAFVLVCAGVLRLEADPTGPRGKFRVPRIASRFVIPAMAVFAVIMILVFTPYWPGDFVRSQQLYDRETFVANVQSSEAAAREYLSTQIKLDRSVFDTTATEVLLTFEEKQYKKLVQDMPVPDSKKYDASGNVLPKDELVKKLSGTYEPAVREFLSTKIRLDPDTFAATPLISLLDVSDEAYSEYVRAMPIPDDLKFASGMAVFQHNIPMWVFLLITLYMIYRCAVKNLSLIPVLGLLSCLYMMSQLGWRNWAWFTGWLLVGLVIYFSFSFRNSKLNTVPKE